MAGCEVSLHFTLASCFQLHFVKSIQVIYKAFLSLTSVIPDCFSPSDTMRSPSSCRISHLTSYPGVPISGYGNGKCLPRLPSFQKQKIRGRKGESIHSGEHQKFEHRASLSSPYLTILLISQRGRDHI